MCSLPLRLCISQEPLKGDSSLLNHVASDDALQVTMVAAKDKGAIVVEGLGAAGQCAAPNMNSDALPERDATSFPFLGQLGEFSTSHARVIRLEFLQD